MGNDDVFQLCAEICFPCMVPNQTWKNNHQHVLLSKIVTIADEALALVVLENNFLEWIEIAKGNEIDKKSRKTKYTHGGVNHDGTKKGWTLEGKLRFNCIFDEVQRQRETRTSKQLEARIKAIWYDANPKNVKNSNTSDADMSDAARALEIEEAQYVPRTDFDLET